MYAFRDKYFGLPGDLRNATQIWGDQASGTSACADASIADGSPGTCNGNGNGLIAGDLGESLRAMQHLALAGMIEGSFTGIVSSVNSGQLAGENIPILKVQEASMWPRSVAQAQYGKSENNHFRIASMRPSDSRYFDGVMKAEEAWNIDSKMDDGLASRGKFASFYDGTTASTCTTGHYSLAAGCCNYVLTSTAKDCTILYWLD
jgi:hypothetical protein